jgi:hypothetical protein
MGDAAKPDVDPATGDLLPLANPQALQRVLLSRWEELSKLDGLPRQRILFEAHSPRAENWLLERDPASVLPALMMALPEDERRREMAKRKLEERLRQARVDVLEKLREESSGEQKELVQRAIDASNALR